MQLQVKKVIPNLRVHTTINEAIIASNRYGIYRVSSKNFSIKKLNNLPHQSIKKVLSNSRAVSRLLRLGISHINKIFNNLVLIFCNNSLILSDDKFTNFDYIDIPIRCFQIMDHNICSTENYVYYGEYFPNNSRKKVRVYRSDNGEDWDTVHTFPAGMIRHIHVLQHDPYEDKIWFATGDTDNESMIGFTNHDFSNLQVIGKGAQKWRTLEFYFTQDKVYWGMDAEKHHSYLIEYDRAKNKTTLREKFDGPIYNLKKIREEVYVVGTAAEGGSGETDNRAHIWLSDDLHHWDDLISYEKDNFPYLMGYGRILFPLDIKNKIIFSGLGLKKIDNKLIIGEII